MITTDIIMFTTAMVLPSSLVTSTSAVGPEALTNTKDSTKIKAGAIAGILIGALALLGGAVPLTRYIWRQRKFRKHKEEQKKAALFYREKLVRRVYPVQ